MTLFQLFAFFLLPIALVAFAGIVFLVEGRRLGRKVREPDLFDKKALRTPGE